MKKGLVVAKTNPLIICNFIGAEGQNFNGLGRSNAPEVYPPLEDAQAADTGIFSQLP